LGQRETRPAPMAPEIAKAYHDLLVRLEGPELWEAPQRLLTLGKPALRVRDAFDREIEPQLAEGGALGGISDWAGKLPGLAVRIPGWLHEVEHAPSGATVVKSETMKSAVEIARWALAHALACFSEMELEQDLAIARKVWRWISKRGLAEVDDQALWQACKGG